MSLVKTPAANPKGVSLARATTSASPVAPDGKVRMHLRWANTEGDTEGGTDGGTGGKMRMVLRWANVETKPKGGEAREGLA